MQYTVNMMTLRYEQHLAVLGWQLDKELSCHNTIHFYYENYRSPFRNWLIILTFVLVIGSAMIPHFWLLSGSILLGIMVLIAIHDLRIRRVIRKED